MATISRNIGPSRALRRQEVVTLLRGVSGVVVLALIVELLAAVGPASWQIPNLKQLGVEVYRFVGSDPQFVGALLHTLWVVVLSLAVALAAGVLVGVLLALSRGSYRALTLLLELVRPVPAIALIPLMILALGQGQSMEIAVTAFAAWWPIMFNALYGARGVEPLTLQTARVFGLRKAQTTARVILPATLPMIVTGLRVAAPLALIVAVGAEYLATAGQGLGGVLIQATSTGDLLVLWAAAVVTGVLGLVLGGLVWLVGKVACPWSTEW